MLLQRFSVIFSNFRWNNTNITDKKSVIVCVTSFLFTTNEQKIHKYVFINSVPKTNFTTNSFVEGLVVVVLARGHVLTRVLNMSVIPPPP